VLTLTLHSPRHSTVTDTINRALSSTTRTHPCLLPLPHFASPPTLRTSSIIINPPTSSIPQT
jgi:hypothetical protein